MDVALAFYRGAILVSTVGDLRSSCSYGCHDGEATPHQTGPKPAQFFPTVMCVGVVGNYQKKIFTVPTSSCEDFFNCRDRLMEIREKSPDGVVKPWRRYPQKQSSRRWIVTRQCYTENGCHLRAVLWAAHDHGKLLRICEALERCVFSLLSASFVITYFFKTK